eukprot:8230496-Ditylum_brightwellii.AAC.1
MITNTSLLYSTLKKCVPANTYHPVRDEIVSRIASIVHCNTKYNLTDMATKSLNGAIHQFLPPNQQFPPVLTAGGCKTDLKKQSVGAMSGTAKYVHTVLSPLDLEIISSFEDERFISHLG